MDNKNVYSRIVDFLEKKTVAKKYPTDKVLAILDDLQFFFKPGSTMYHHNYDGGLAEHTLQVMENADRIYKAFSDTDKYSDVEYADIIIACLLHDIGKCFPGFYIPTVKGKWKSGPEYHSNPHEVTSAFISVKELDVPIHVFKAILSHNGMYTHTGEAFFEKHNESPLAYLVHVADMLSAF